MTVRGATLFLLIALVAPAALGSETGLSGREGHPRARFPLTIHAEPQGDRALDAAVRRAVDDWNALARDTLGVEVFAWSQGRPEADVVLAAEPATTSRMMGIAHVRSDDRGVITLPVRIVLFEIGARGQTAREILVYQVAAHELGHALGLTHTREPGSLMCCVKGSVDFEDPAARAAYLEGRRHPDVRSARAQLTEHYARFWRDGN